MPPAWAFCLESRVSGIYSLVRATDSQPAIVLLYLYHLRLFNAFVAHLF